MEMKFNTKKIQYFYNRYKAALYSADGSIWTVYKKPSLRKRKVWLDILDEYKRLNGHGLAVISHCAAFFTAAFIYYTEDNRRFFVVITKENRYISEIKE